MKKIMMYVCIFSLILLTGCGGNFNSSPEMVAEEMAKRMSSGDYKNIDELIYFDDNGFVDEVSFKNYLNEKDLVIEGNNKYEVVGNDSSLDDRSTVKISIDNNRILQVNTMKKNDKWYVDLGSYEYDSDLVIKVPTGSKVYLNNVKLDYDIYAKTESRETYWKVGSNKYDYTYSVDTYTISSLLSGIYNLKVENKNISTIEEKIYSDKSDYNYYMDNDKGIFNSGNESYVVNTRVSSTIENDIKTFMNDFYNNMITNIEGKKEFSSMNKYFDTTETTSLEQYESLYNKILKGMVNNSYSTWTEYNSDLKITLNYEDATSGIYYVSDDKYFVVAKRTLDYISTRKYDKGWYDGKEDVVDEESKSAFVVFDVEKTKDGYIVNGGINLIPSL